MPDPVPARPVANRLAESASPYLRAHADNPVDWWPWGPEPFAEARRRDVPVLLSIGYSTCHWCHVMARESFSDPVIAAELNARFVAVKVDREERPEVDSATMAAAGAFTHELGWPLTAFATPDGRVFHAGTYFPPEPIGGRPSFRQVLDAVSEAWTGRRDEVEGSAAGLARALAASAPPSTAAVTSGDLVRVADELVLAEDRRYGGFGGAPKFPVAPALLLARFLAGSPLLDTDSRDAVGGVADRALAAMAASGLRDPVEGGFFRYATRRDWSVPHYERMLTDNALLLDAYAAAGDRDTAAGIVRFLDEVLARASGAFGAAQDSESEVDGRRVEGGYYALDVAARGQQPRPAVDGKVLTGWNGLAIGALANAGERLGEPGWVRRAERAADAVLASNRRPDGSLLRATLDLLPSDAPGTLEDVGALADGLLSVALAAGRVDLAVAARALVDDVMHPDGALAVAGDPVLAGAGVSRGADLVEGSAPSGPSAAASAAWRLFLLTGDERYRRAADRTLAPVVGAAVLRPLAGAAALRLAGAMLEPIRQIVVVGSDDDLATAARGRRASITAVVSDRTALAFAEAGFELFAGRTAGDRALAYVCEDFVCRLPVATPAAVRATT